MSVIERACLIIYRVAEKGLEVFLVNGEGPERSVWSIPQQDIPATPGGLLPEDDKIIEIDPIEMGKGHRCRAIAIEGDYHDIPSMRSLIKEDVKYVAEKVRTMIPDLEHGGFVALREAIKSLLPHENKLLTELRDIVTDRNQIKDL